MARTPKTLAEKGYFRKTHKNRNIYKYMQKFYRTFFKPGRAKPFTVRKTTLYTCKYVFPPQRGYMQGRPCVDDVYGLPDPDCPACGGTGHPQQSDKFRDIRVMGLLAPINVSVSEVANASLSPELIGNVGVDRKKLVCGLPISPEYTETYGLKPKTDILDKNGNVIETDVLMGYRLEMNDIIIWQEEFFDGYVNKIEEVEYFVTGFLMDHIEIGYFKILQVAEVTLKNVNNANKPMGRFGQ